jgi:hypothetical protein
LLSLALRAKILCLRFSKMRPMATVVCGGRLATGPSGEARK